MTPWVAPTTPWSDAAHIRGAPAAASFGSRTLLNAEAAMPADRHSVVREGFIAGVIGAALVALWYFVVDLAAGEPLRTPQMIGQLIMHGTAGIDRAVSPAAVLVATVVHGAGFVLVGIALTALVHLASREIAWRMGVLIGLVIAAGFASGLIFAVTPATGERFSSWVVVGGSLIAVAGMAAYLWRRHPVLAASFRDVALGDETESPPHPPLR